MKSALEAIFKANIAEGVFSDADDWEIWAVFAEDGSDDWRIVLISPKNKTTYFLVDDLLPEAAVFTFPYSHFLRDGAMFKLGDL